MESTIDERDKVAEKVNNEASFNQAYIESVEDTMTTLDGTLRPTRVVEDEHATLGDSGYEPLAIGDLLPPQFVQRHADVEDAEVLFAPHGVEDAADLLEDPSAIDAHVAADTDFEDLSEMLESAIEERIG